MTWLSVGISGQRTRLYQTNLDIQRGLLAGASLKNWELTSLPFRGALVALVTNECQQCGVNKKNSGVTPIHCNSHTTKNDNYHINNDLSLLDL